MALGASLVYCGALSEGAIDVLSVSDFDDVDDQSIVFDAVNDAISALTDPIAILTGEFLGADGARIVAEFIDPLDDSLTVLLSGNGLDLLHGRGFDKNPISSHYVSDP